MKKINLSWTLSHTPNISTPSRHRVPASVPGDVQLDYARAEGYAPYYYGLGFRQFDWMEDEYFIYESELHFECSARERAFLCFEGINYAYEILLDGRSVCRGEGMFTPVEIDITGYSGKAVPLQVVLDPIPKCCEERTRDQARESCKPASSYGWDWHPRLVPTGLWGEAYIKTVPLGAPLRIEAAYTLSEALDRVDICAELYLCGECEAVVELIDPRGDICASTAKFIDGCGSVTLSLDNPELWYPRGYGEQPIYTFCVRSGGECAERRLGFRRSRLVRNADDALRFERGGAANSALPAPATIEINGVRIFAKGSNWVNTEIFPSMITDSRYDELLQLAYDANMNILRMWGGQFINREHFYGRCDELGIMIWQEFMLSCNCHPDNDRYLSVLEQEALTIIKRLRTHPCLAFWCGGNELFNSWSGLSEQSLPLRLLSKLCYENDRHTPFNMTSPLHGMAHGTYMKVILADRESEEAEQEGAEEFIEQVKREDYTAFTEFGCNGGATPEYIKKYIMDESDYNDCSSSNEVWRAHHAFGAFGTPCWLGKGEVGYYFGSWRDVDDLMEKTLFLQALTYKSMFEEMRRRWPYCSMALNWDFNEPWPCAAGNSLINWPAEPKPCYFAVAEALRPRMLSLEAQRNRYLTGEMLTGTVWMLNDSAAAQDSISAEIYLVDGDKKTLLARVDIPAAAPRQNSRGDSFSFRVDEGLPERFSITVESQACPVLNSIYDFVHKI